jgi:hypothetical protein|tara:strand:+ start:839 stop:1177 length:339 start_codon:yes stop_codon:yes gene_type:complete
MNVMDNIKGHYADQLSGGLNKISVTEWKTDIYCKKAYPFSVEAAIIKLQQEGKTVEALVESLIQKALDVDGNKMFTKFDKNALMNEADPNVLIRVCGELNRAVSEYEAIEKN